MSSIIQQVIGTFIVCTLGINFGILFAWPSSTLKLFSSTDTNLNRPMTEMELALLGSLSSVTALISTPLSGFLLDLMGRKYTCILFALPQVLAWTLISVFSRVEVILLAMCISGLGGCFFTITPVYIAEICQENIRGAMTACSIIFYGIGIMFSYLLGGYLKYDIMSYACISLAVAGVVLMAFLKESPTFLMKEGLEEDAAKNIAFYRSIKVGDKEVLQEMNMIRKILNPQMDGLSAEEEKLNDGEKIPKKLSLIEWFRNSKATRRGLMIVIVMYTCSVFQGLVAVEVYAEPLFGEAMPTISANLTSIMFALVNTIVGFVAAYLTDILGRRWLMMYSSLASGLCCVALGSQIHLHWGPHWITAVIMYAFCITYTAGAGTVPYVIVADVFLPEVRSILTMAAGEWAWICNFIVLFIFNPLVGAIGLGPIFYLFAVICFLSAVFSFFYLPETKGLTVDVVQTLLIKRVH